MEYINTNKVVSLALTKKKVVSLAQGVLRKPLKFTSQKFRNKLADVQTIKRARPPLLKAINKIGILCFQPPK